MQGMIAGRTAGSMPGLDIAEQRAWQNFLDTTLRLHAAMNRTLAASHKLTLADVRLLDILDHSAAGSARMGDLAEVLVLLPSRVTRQIRRLEANGLVRRTTSPEDGRGVLASITASGRDAVRQAMATYAQAVRVHFLDQLTRSQLAAMGDNCRRISASLKPPDGAAG